jgi:hypothetical protein
MPELARAGDVESWNTMEAILAHGKQWRLECGGFVRVNQHMTEAYDDGLRCRVNYVLTPRVTVIGGFVQRWIDKDGKGHIAEERPVTGVAIRLTDTRRFRAESQTEVEFFNYPSGKASYTRYRSKIDLEKPGRVIAPVFSEELFFTKTDGLVRTRTIAGIRHRMEGGGRFEFGYQFQNDLTNGAWVPKHAVRTAMYFGDIFHRSGN